MTTNIAIIKKKKYFPIKEKLEEGVNQEARKMLVQITVAELIKRHGYYPSSRLKSEVARAIVAAYPNLGSTVLKEAHLAFYDNETNQGFIEYRLKTSRVTLSPNKKKRKIQSSQLSYSVKQSSKKNILQPLLQNPLSVDDMAIKVSELKFKTPNAANKDLIFQLMDETRYNRQKAIADKEEGTACVTEVLEKFPRFKDYNGELIEQEFSAMYPNKDGLFIATFPSIYTPRILKYVELYKPHLLDDMEKYDDNLKALLLLVEILPVPNHAKKRKKIRQVEEAEEVVISKNIPNEALLIFVHPGHDILDSSKPSTRKQPFLICAARPNQKNGAMFIRVDNHLFSVPSEPLKAFDILVKLHFCFDIAYAPELTNFYNFITGCVFRMNLPRGICDTLNNSLMNIYLGPAQEGSSQEEFSDDLPQ